MADRMKIDVTTNHRKSRNEDFYREFFSSSSGSDDDSAETIPNKNRNKRSRPKRKYKKLSDLSDVNVEPDSCAFSGRSKIDVASALRAPLCTKLFYHFFRHIWSNSPEEKREQCTYFNCFWFLMYMQEHNREKVLKLIQKKNIFSKKYVLIPIVLWNHWYLVIFCNFGEKIRSETRSPCILLLDSLHELNPWRLQPIIRRFVSDIYETENRVEDKYLVKEIPFEVPKVPQQRNGYACGVFALYYASLFLENAPENFSLSLDSDYPYFMDKDWFTDEELEGFYKRLESIGIDCSDDSEGSGDTGPATTTTTNGNCEGQFEGRSRRTRNSPVWHRDYFFI